MAAAEGHVAHARPQHRPSHALNGPNDLPYQHLVCPAFCSTGRPLDARLGLMTENPDADRDRREEDEPAKGSLSGCSAREIDGEIDAPDADREDPQ